MTNNNEKSGNSSTITSGKNKASGSSSNNNSDKPKPPQRGLGVAQLEKIRLQKQLASCGAILPHHQAFLNPPFQYVPEGMRYQLGYQEGLQGAALAPPPPPLLLPPFSYSPPLVPHRPSYDYHYHPNNVTMRMGDHHMQRGYAESLFLPTARWNPNSNEMVIQEHHPQQPGMVTRHLLGRVENRESSTINHDLGRANNDNAEPSGNGEPDLELKL